MKILWRRVDGLILPMTTIQRITKSSLPKLIKELAICLKSPPSALVTALWNRKGGVAKTTNTINVAACLAMANKRVLLVDLDPQNDLTTGIGLQANFAPDYFDRAYERLQLQDYDLAKQIVTSAIQVKQFSGGHYKFTLSLLSSDRDRLNSIVNANYAHSPQVIFNQILKLIRDRYDYIFIDCSPKQDKLAECLLCTAEAIILPIDDDCKALNHAVDISSNMQIVRSMRSKSDAFTLGPWNLGLVSSKCPVKSIANNWSNIMVATLERNLTATPLGQVLRLPCKFIQGSTTDTPQPIIDAIAERLASSGRNVLPVMVEVVKKDKYTAIFNQEILVAAKQAGLDFIYCIAIDKEMAAQLKIETSKIAKVDLNTSTEADLIDTFKTIKANIATLGKIDPVVVAKAIVKYRASRRIQDLNFMTGLKCGIGKAKLPLLAERFVY